MQPAPRQRLIWLTVSVLVMTPARRPAEPHTTTRSVPVRRSIAAWISGASSAIVTSLSRAAGNNLSTNTLCLLAHLSSDGAIHAALAGRGGLQDAAAVSARASTLLCACTVFLKPRAYCGL